MPHQHTTGGKTRLVGISKRGNSYPRRLIIDGARAAIGSLATEPTSLGRWVAALLTRVHGNVAVVALANKLTRIAGPSCAAPSRLRQCIGWRPRRNSRTVAQAKEVPQRLRADHPDGEAVVLDAISLRRSYIGTAPEIAAPSSSALSRPRRSSFGGCGRLRGSPVQTDNEGKGADTD